MTYIKLCLLILCFFSYTIQAQELNKKIKTTIGWNTYAYHITGDIYNTKTVYSYDKQENLLLGTEKYNTNIDTNFLFKCDAKNRVISKSYFHFSGALDRLVQYQYFDHKDYYIEKETHTAVPLLTYYYLGSDKQVIEKKSVRLDKNSELEEWIIYTYNDQGLLIGKRYKVARPENIFEEVYIYKSKEVYHYKKGTTTLVRIDRYYWDENKQKEILRKDKSFDYEYDAQGRILKEHDKGTQHEGGFYMTTYQYKNGKIWIKTGRDARYTFKNIYKDGILVVSREYWKDSGRDLNGVKDLMSEEYFDYIYYDE